MKNRVYVMMYKTELTYWWNRIRRKIVHNIFSAEMNAGGSFVAGLNGGIAATRPPLNILDAGCGTGALLQELQQYGECYGIDSAQQAVDFCRERSVAHVRLGDVSNIPFADNSFDVVLALDVLEHLENDVRAIQETKRVLKPGGIAIFFVPALMFLWGMVDEESNHYRRYTRRELNEKIREGGLEIKRSSYFNTFLFPLAATFRFVSRFLPPRKRMDNDYVGPFFNKIFYLVFYLESLFLQRMDFPFGVSVLSVCKKQESKSLP